MNTIVHGDRHDLSGGTSVDPIVAESLREEAPSQNTGTGDSKPLDEEALYQWFKDAQNSLPNIHVAPGNYKLSLQSVEEIETLWEQSVDKQPLMEKMFKSAMGESLPAATSATTDRPKSKSLQRGLSFCADPRKLVETSDKWHTFLEQLHKRRRKIYGIVNALHDQRLSEQRAILDDIEQGFGQVHSDSKDLKQLQLEQTRIKDYPDRLKECQIVIEKVLSMPTPTLTTEGSGSKDDQQILEHYVASIERANQMLTRCGHLSEQLQILFSNLQRKINHEFDEILFQIDELNDWLEDAYKLFILRPTNLSHADKYLLLDWEKIFNSIELEYGESSILDATLLPGESSVDLNTSDVTDWEQEPKHTAECILGMIEDILSVHKLEAKAHKLELCLARGNLIAMETNVLTQLSRIQVLWQHLRYYGDRRIAELKFAIKMQKTFELLSEGQDELMNFEEEYIDLDHETLENEFIDFKVFFYEIEFFPSLDETRDEMCKCLEVYLSLCSPNTELKFSEDSLKREVENLQHEYEDMVVMVNSQNKFYEDGLEMMKNFHKVIDKFKEWLTTAEEVVYRELYGNSYQELCAYYDAVKSFLGDLIQQEENFEAIMRMANTILDQCSDDVEEQLNKTIDELNNRWVAVSDIIVNLEIDIYKIIQLWAAYERRYAEIQEFVVDLSTKIQKEPLETSHGDSSLLPKYKAVNESIVKYKPEYEELINDLGQKLANHDKLGTKEKIEADMDKLKMQWEQLCDNVSASIESLQQELSDWFSSTYAQLEAYLQKSNEMLQQIKVVISVDPNLDDTLGDQIQSANALITDHYAVFSEENSQTFYLLLEKVFGRRLPHDLDAVETLVLDFEPLSHEDIAKTEALQTIWNENWELAKLHLILLKLRVKVLEYMTIIHDGQTFCSIQFDVDLESLETALRDYENKFNEEYFKSLQSLMEQMRHLADEFTKSCPDGEEKVPQGDSREVVFVTQQESYDDLTSVVNGKCATLQQHIKLWHNYNELKEAVSTVIDNVQGSVDTLKERSRDPTVPPTSIVESANQLKLEFESNTGIKQAFIAAKEELAEVLQENAIVDNQVTEEMMQISTSWHNLLVTLNQFVSQATQRSEEFVAFVTDINKLATEITYLKKSVEEEIDTDLPQRDNQDYARRMIERRDILEALQMKFKEFQEKRDSKEAAGVSWQPTKIPKHLLVEFPSELFSDEADGEDSDWLVHNQFDVLAKQMATLQAQLDKHEDKLEKNEETILIFKGLSNDLLSWLQLQLALPEMNKLPDANLEQLQKDISVLQSLQDQVEAKVKEDKMELDEQLAKLEKRNLREDTRLEIQQIAKHLDETMADLESKVADQLAKFSEAKLNLISFLDKANKFEEWLNEVEAELETYWPLGADLPLLLEKGAHINEKVKNAVDSKIALPNELLDTEESIRPLFDPGSHSSISVLPVQIKERYNQVVDDCEEKIEHIQDATNELQQFMVTYEKFMKWLEATLNAAVTRSETKHSVGVTESKLEEHKEFVIETIEVKVEEFEALKENSVPLKEKYPPSDWLDGKMKETCDQWDELLSCCDNHRKHLEWLLEKWVTYERTVSELLDWVMTEAERFAKEVTTRGDKGVVDHIKSCEELHANLEDKNAVMGVVIEMSEELAKHDVRKENGTDDISSRRNDVVQHWDSLINLLAETLLRLEATYAELRHVLQVLEEESDLIGGLETRAALPPTCHGNTEILSQQIDHFQAVLVETESHNDKISYLRGYLDFVEEHSSKDDREPRQQEINDVVTRHAALIERSNRVLTVGGQALPIWQEYNDTTTKLLEWIIECDQKLCTAEYQSGNALVTKQSLENCKILLGEIVSQQAMVEDTTGQSSVLTTYCLTEDDKQFLAHSTTQHVDNYQELLEACRERVLLLEQRELTWQSFPVAEAIVVEELAGSIDEAVDVEFTNDTMAADMYGYLEQLEELETQQEENENTVTVIDTALNKEEVQKASQENPDINEEKNRLMAVFTASKARLKEKLARVKAQVKAVTELEDAINRLEACVNDHRAIVMSNLPVGPVLEIEHEKLKEAGVNSQTELASALQNFDTVLLQFNQPVGGVQLGIPPDLNRRVENLKETCPELLEAGENWPTKVEDSLAAWMGLKETIEKLNGWISTAESEFGSIQNIPKFLMDFNALEDRFQIHADSLQDQNERYTVFITAIKPHLDSGEEVVAPFRKKVDKLSQRWDTLNEELGELEQAMVPWRQLLDCRDALEHFLTPLEEVYEVEAANANQQPLGSDFTPFIVRFKESLRKMSDSENLLLDLQQKVEVNLTEEVYKKHASARKLHQLCEQLVTRWNDLKQNLNDVLESIQLKQPDQLAAMPSSELMESSAALHKQQLKEFASTLSAEQCRQIIVEAFGNRGSIELVMSIMSPQHPESPEPALPWCECRKCHVMPLPYENVCCKQTPCVTTLDVFETNVLNTDVLSIALVSRCDDLADTAEYTPAAYRKTAYRQWIMWQHGYLGRYNKNVIPSCVVWAVRNKFPAPDGNYLDFKQ